ncbi:MAG: protein kinase [Planctomycetota bacterium]
MTDSDTSSEFEDLVAAYCAGCDAGETATPEEFANQHPEGGPGLLPALKRLVDAMSLLPSADLPTELGRYHVEGRLGRGATGEVFAVRDDAGRELALKRLLPHASSQPRALERLRREGEVLRSLDCDGIVRIVAVESIDGMPAVVMERILGPSLAVLLDRARERRERDGQPLALDFRELPGAGAGWLRAVALVAALARSLAVAHDRGVLHRDLKPSNVRLRADGRPVLVDFGLAHDPDAATLTATGDLLGTPNYMAPEQAGGHEVGVAADIYGLGAILYELVTGQPPHTGHDAVAALAAVRSGPPRPARQVAGGVPKVVELLLRRALAFRPSARWPSAAAFAAVLQLAADGGGGDTLALPVRQRSAEWLHWHRRGVVATGVAGVLVAVGITVMGAVTATRASAAAAAFESLCTAELDGNQESKKLALEKLRGTDFEPDVVSWLAGGEPRDEFVIDLAAARTLVKSDPRAAIAALENSVRQRPELAYAGALLGMAAASAESWQIGERELTAASRRLPKSIRLCSELAALYRSTNDHPAAVAAYERALRLSPGDARIWSLLARSRGENGDPAGGLAAMERAKALHDGERPPVQWLRIEAALLDGAGRKDEAVAITAEVCRRSPSAANWNNHGRTLDGLHHMAEAATAYRKALELDRDYVSAAFHLAFLLAGSKRATCPECEAFYRSNPTYLAPAEVEQLALRVLEIQAGSFDHVVPICEIVQQSGRTAAVLERVEAHLAEDLSVEALGRLAKARNLLRAR